MRTADPRWYESFFDSDDWVMLAVSRTPEQTEREVAFLTDRIAPTARVLDLACGTGRIATELARRGYDVAGLDISHRVLDVARREAPELDLRQGDMRELPWPDASFGAVINIWTAFGYFETQAEDERVLAEVVRVLEPGGRFVLDTVNQTALVRGFRPKSWSEEADGVLMLEEREYSVFTGRATARWTFVRDGVRSELAFDHRVYTCPEYVELLGRAGMRTVEACGDFDGGELTWDSWRLILVAEREPERR